MSTERAIELQEEAWALQAKGRLVEASRVCREALRLVEAADGPESPDAANLLNNLSEIESDRQDFDAVPVLSDHGGWGRADRVFGGQLEQLVADLNRELVAA